MQQSISAYYGTLDGLRDGLKRRVEEFARLSIPSVYPKSLYNNEKDGIDYANTSLTAAGVNHLCNKFMLTLFGVQLPFFRLELATSIKTALMENGVSSGDLETVLAAGEIAVFKTLADSNIRVILYEVLRHLIVAGDVILYLPDSSDKVVMYPLYRYVQRRSETGKTLEAIIKTTLHMSELVPELQTLATVHCSKRNEDTITRYDHLRLLADGRYEHKVYLEDKLTPANYHKIYTQDDMPYHFLAYNLSPACNYGTGHIEEHYPDVVALDTVSGALIDTSVLVSEYRWLANPASNIDVQAVQNSRNGDVLEGGQNDLSLLQSVNVNSLNYLTSVRNDYRNDIGRVFLLNSAVTRQAERVTVEEIRQQAQELDTAFNGSYTRFSASLQAPIAKWGMRNTKDIFPEEIRSVIGNSIKPNVITGVEIYDRNVELSRLTDFVQYVLNLTSKGDNPQLDYLKIDAILTKVAGALRLTPSEIIRTFNEVQQIQSERRRAESANTVATEALLNQGAQP